MQKAKKKNDTKFKDRWYFAIVNSRLAEIYFNRESGI